MAKRRKPKPLYEPLFDLTHGHYIECFTDSGKEQPTPQGMPGTVNLQGKHFTIRYHTRIFSAEKDRLRGMILFHWRLIIIDPNQSIHDMRETLYHEMAHAYLHEWQAKSPALEKLTDEQVEEVCDLFAASLYDSLLNGPKL